MIFLIIALALSFIVAIDKPVSLAISFSNSIAFSEVFSLEKSYKLSIIRDFISSTALFVKVMAKIFLYASLVGELNKIFRYSFVSV